MFQVSRDGGMVVLFPSIYLVNASVTSDELLENAILKIEVCLVALHPSLFPLSSLVTCHSLLTRSLTARLRSILLVIKSSAWSRKQVSKNYCDLGVEYRGRLRGRCVVFPAKSLRPEKKRK